MDPKLPLRLIGAALVVAIAATPAVAAADPGVLREIRDISARIARAPAEPTLLIRRADLERRVGRYEDALSDLALAEASGADSARVHLVRARIHADRGDEERALRLLEASTIEMRPLERAEAYAIAGRIHEEAGRVSAAVEAYDESLAIRDDVELYAARGRLLIFTGRTHDAIASYEAGVEALAGAAILRAELTELLLAGGAYERALVHADALVASSRATSRWRVLRARIHEARGRRDLARADREAALADAERVLARRGSALARLERARVFAALGRRDEAIEDLGRVIRRAPQLSEARVLLHRLERGGAR